MKRRASPEQVLQRAVCQHLTARAAPGVVWFAVPNGGYRPPIEAAIMKGTGTKKGAPDMVLYHRKKAYALELKAHGKKPTAEQCDFHDRLMAAGCSMLWSDNLDIVLHWLEVHGLLRGRASA